MKRLPLATFLLASLGQASALTLQAACGWTVRQRCATVPHRASSQCCEDRAAGPFSDDFWAELTEQVGVEANRLGLEVESVSFQKGTLRILATGGVDDLQSLNQAISSFLDSEEDELESLPPFMLEVSSPGLSPSLSTDLDFISFKGFDVNVETSEAHKGKTNFSGTLVGRDDEFVTINNKGRLSKIPRGIVTLVQLPTAKTEPGDPLS
ncbi:hypothetical protein AB1Y20_002521 [Prymnesium parvum]|uniref:Ribosome maturation factor RimP N-terminal domain-containing protein n=1 Tax=Prymnesium parvum TaxID=97485 RepID=A0AB34J9A5_PRYPA